MATRIKEYGVDEQMLTIEEWGHGTAAVMEVAGDELANLLAVIGENGQSRDMIWLWYPRGETVVFGVWTAVPDEDAYEDGDGEWHRDIMGGGLPSSPPWVELVFQLEQCGPALRARAETSDSYTAGMLRGAIAAAREASGHGNANVEKIKDNPVAASDTGGELTIRTEDALPAVCWWIWHVGPGGGETLSVWDHAVEASRDGDDRLVCANTCASNSSLPLWRVKASISGMVACSFLNALNAAQIPSFLTSSTT